MQTLLIVLIVIALLILGLVIYAVLLLQTMRMKTKSLWRRLKWREDGTRKALADFTDLHDARYDALISALSERWQRHKKDQEAGTLTHDAAPSSPVSAMPGGPRRYP